MRLVLAILRPGQVESVRQALAAVSVTRLTIGDAHGYGVADGGPEPAQEALLEIAVNDDFVERTVGTIGAALGTDVAGRLFVLPMHDAVQIYRAVRGPEAV